MDKVLWPVGAVSHEKPAYAATIAVEVFNRNTIIEPAILTGDATLNLDIDPETPKGALMTVKAKATNAGDDLTFGTGIDAPVLVGAAGKTKVQSFIYDGTAFIANSAPVQID